MQEKKAQPQQPTQNLQMMRDEPREEDQSVNIVLRSRITAGNDKGKHPIVACNNPPYYFSFDINTK